jgi:hypothetical protein
MGLAGATSARAALSVTFIEQLISSYYAPSMTADQAAALQCAMGLSLGGGSLGTPNKYTFTVDAPAAIATAAHFTSFWAQQGVSRMGRPSVAHSWRLSGAD